MKSTTAPFTGVIDGDAVTLTFNQLFGIQTNVNGSIDVDGLHLNMPSESSGLSEVVFARSSLDDYHRQVAALQQGAASTRQAQQRQAQAAAEAQARQDAIDAANQRAAAEAQARRDAIAQARAAADWAAQQKAYEQQQQAALARQQAEQKRQQDAQAARQAAYDKCYAEYQDDYKHYQARYGAWVQEPYDQQQHDPIPTVPPMNCSY